MKCLEEDEEANDILEIVEKTHRLSSSTADNIHKPNASANISNVNLHPEGETTISIIESLANNNSNISLGEEKNGTPEFLLPGITVSSNLNSDLLNPISEIFTNSKVIEDDLLSDSSVEDIDNSNFNHPDQKSHNISDQDFFFNNPFKNKRALSSAAIENQDYHLGLHSNDSLQSLDSDSTHSISHSPSVISGSGSAVIKPKAKTKSSQLPIELTNKKISTEPQLSGMRIQRSTPSRRMSKNLGHGFAEHTLLSKKISALETSSEISKDENDKKSLLSSFIEKLDEEESHIMGFNADNNKVSPFGGFSRPHLLERENLFNVAPWKIVDFEKGNVSLQKAIELAREQEEFSDDFKWVGTVSMPTNVVPEEIKNNISKELQKNYSSEVVFLDDDLFQGHYQSFCKKILWPIFHYQIPDNPKSYAFENNSWKDYEEVNKKFAEKIAKVYKDGDQIWVHDYHLMLLPLFLRKLIPNAKIGFFLHISFPSSEVFRCLAQRDKILQGILGADCVTFQTEEYVGHFLQSCNRLILADFDDKTIYYQGNEIKVSFNPIGLSFDQLNTQLHNDSVLEWRKLIRDRWKGKKIIVNRDKMDQIRGIKEKLLSYEKFLDNNLEYLNITTLILISHRSSTVDEDYENEVLNIVERINSKTNNISMYQPVTILHQDVQFDQYLALLCEADLFIVSTLREGMNLTCHEFICATQEKHSPLILSEFVGSAAVLTKGPLLVNPYNVKQVSENIYNALTMSDEDKLINWRDTYSHIVKHDSQHWLKYCLNDIQMAYNNKQEQSLRLLKPISVDLFNKNMSKIDSKCKRLYILNLDNLATNIHIEGQVIHSVQQQLINTTINNLCLNKNNYVYLLSLYQRSDLIRKYRRVQNVGFIAENGGYIKPPHKNKWYSVVDKNDLKWMDPVINVMNDFCERILGSYVEIKECTVRLHTENAIDIDKDHKNGLVGDFITHVNELYAKEFNVHATLVQGIVIVQEKNLMDEAIKFVLSFNEFEDESLKSPVLSAAEYIPKKKSNFIQYEFVMACGSSSHIDENLYQIINELPCENLSVRVGQMGIGTCAQVALQGINELMMALNK